MQSCGSEDPAGSSGRVTLVEELLRRGYAASAWTTLQVRPGQEVIRRQPASLSCVSLVEAIEEVGLMIRHAGPTATISSQAPPDRRNLSYSTHIAYEPARTNERIMPRPATPRSPRTGTGGCGRSPTCRSSWYSESADEWPSYGGQQRERPQRCRSYGFQKLGGGVSTSPAPPGAVQAP